MKQIIKLFTIFLMVVGIVYSMSVEVKAGRTESPNLAEKFGYGEDVVIYDCGTSTVDGFLKVHSDSHSLKEGDIIEVQMIYNGENNKIGTYSGTNMKIEFDKNLLEYMDTTFEDDYLKTYRPYLEVENRYDDGIEWMSGNNIDGFGGNGRIAKLQFKVKKATESVQMYFRYIYLCGLFWDSKNFDYYDFRYSSDLAMENDKTMQAWLESGFVVPGAEDIGKDWEDVLTLTIEDSDFVPQKKSTLALTTTPTQGTSDITVPINIEKNDGFNLLGLTLDYDPALFTYEALEIDDALKSKISLDSVYEAPGSGRIKASFIALDDITDVGNFLKLKLKVKDGVSPGTSSNVGVEITQVGNKAETAMEGTGTTCAVSITGTTTGEEETPAPGDVNADKKIDLVDAVYILQNYNQVREFTNVQKTVADVDKNGTVNLVDALMIMKYFNGEITAF